MDDNQIQPPPSFVALFTTPGGHRLTEPMAHVRERYELCEDMAQMLTEQAGTLQFKTGGSERDVLSAIAQALSGDEAPLDAQETGWVLSRLAELLGWAPLPPAPDR